MKLKKLEQYLQDLKTFENPKVKLEQYATMPHICARMMHTIQSCYNDIEGKIIADLGCGCGSLSIASCFLEAQLCVGFDIDSDALSIFKENYESFNIENIDLVQCDIFKFPTVPYRKFDTVIMNPPFGTKIKGVDIEFLKVALDLTNNTVYSLHKTSTRNYIVTKAESMGVKAEVLAQLNFDLPATYKFHKKTCVDVEVDFVRFTHK